MSANDSNWPDDPSSPAVPPHAHIPPVTCADNAQETAAVQADVLQEESSSEHRETEEETLLKADQDFKVEDVPKAEEFPASADVLIPTAADDVIPTKIETLPTPAASEISATYAEELGIEEDEAILQDLPPTEPMQWRILTPEEEIAEAEAALRVMEESALRRGTPVDEPPSKKLRLDMPESMESTVIADPTNHHRVDTPAAAADEKLHSLSHNPTPSNHNATSCLIGIINSSFDEAYMQPGEDGDSVFFRLNLVEGSQHIIKRQEANVKYGLALWSKAIQRLLAIESNLLNEEQTNQAELKASAKEVAATAGSDESSSRTVDSSSQESSPAGAGEIDGGGVGAAESSAKQKLKESWGSNTTAGAQNCPDAFSGAIRKTVAASVNKTSAPVRLQEKASWFKFNKRLVTKDDFAYIKDGLDHLEKLSFGAKHPLNHSLPFIYKSGSSLTICGQDLYNCVNDIIVSVISRKGQMLGYHVVELLGELIVVGKAVVEARAAARKSQKQAQPLIVIAPLTRIIAPPVSSLGDAQSLMRPPPPPPPNAHLVRTAKTTATLAAISRFSHHNALASAEYQRTHVPPPIGINRPAPVLQHDLPPVPSCPSPLIIMNGSAPGHRPLPPPPSITARFVTPQSARPAPPPLAGTQMFMTPSSIFEGAPVWVDARVRELPDWVLSTLIDMVQRFEGQVVAAVDQCWYSCYGPQLDFRTFGFTGLHDVLASLPGVFLRREGSEFWVQVSTAVMKEAIRQRWPGPPFAVRPTAGGYVPPEVLEAAARKSRQFHGTPLMMTPTSERVPSHVCAQLRDLVAKHDGCNIGHIQQVWKKEHNDEPLDFTVLGFAKFSDLLQDVPGINLMKEGSTVTAHCAPSGTPFRAATAIVPPPMSLLGRANAKPAQYDQQQLLMMQRMLQMQMQLAAIASLQPGRQG